MSMFFKYLAKTDTDSRRGQGGACQKKHSLLSSKLWNIVDSVKVLLQIIIKCACSK